MNIRFSLLAVLGAAGLAALAQAADPAVIAQLQEKVQRFGGSVEDHYKGFKVIDGSETGDHTVNYFGFDFMGAGHVQSERYELADGQLWRIEQWIFTFGADGSLTFCDHSVFFKGHGPSNSGQLFGDGVFNTDRRCTPEMQAKHEELLGYWLRYQPASPGVPPANPNFPPPQQL